MITTKTKNVDEYIDTFPEQTRRQLRQMRSAIQSAAPDSEEKMAYHMPGYKYMGKPLVYFAGYKQHIGFYAMDKVNEEFARELSQFKQGKGSIQFPLDADLPLDIIKKMVEFRKNEIKEKLKKS